MDTLTSALFALPFLIYMFVQVLRKQSGHSWLDRLLGFVALLVPTSAIFLNTIGAATTPDAGSIVLVLGVISIGLGGILLLMERKQAGYRFSKSRGLLSTGIGVLLIATLLTTPLITSLMSGGAGLSGDAFAETALAASPMEGDMGSSGEVFVGSLASPTPSPTAQSTPTLMPTATFTPFPSATPMPTLPALVLPTSTPGAMPALATPNADGNPTTTTDGSAICQVTTGANLNLRQSPGTDTAILTTIPNGTTLTATETTDDRIWWQVSHNGQVGWVIRDYLYFGAEC